jgi:hypothetical protein
VESRGSAVAKVRTSVDIHNKYLNIFMEQLIHHRRNINLLAFSILSPTLRALKTLFATSIKNHRNTQNTIQSRKWIIRTN